MGLYLYIVLQNALFGHKNDIVTHTRLVYEYRRLCVPRQCICDPFVFHPSTAVTMADDFGSIAGKASEVSSGKSVDQGRKGEKREYLKVFETLAPRLLNAYGEAKFHKTSDQEVWKHFMEPQPTGAVWMTEFCSKDPERRGIAANRMLLPLVNFCKYQQSTDAKRQNQALMDVSKCQELYAEIDRILPSLEYCLAAKKYTAKAGSGALRSAAAPADAEVSAKKDESELDRHAKIVYEWLDVEQVSRIRMLLNWQSSGGLSFVAAVNHRAGQVFRYHGNTQWTPDSVSVTLAEFQAAIKSRHEAGSNGIESTVGGQTNDFS